MGRRVVLGTRDTVIVGTVSLRGRKIRSELAKNKQTDKQIIQSITKFPYFQ